MCAKTHKFPEDMASITKLEKEVAEDCGKWRKGLCATGKITKRACSLWLKSFKKISQVVFNMTQSCWTSRLGPSSSHVPSSEELFKTD